MSSEDFLSSETRLIEFAKTIELEATRYLEGQHHSPRAGHGVEYHSSVPYSEGEDAKYIDWKRYARADRFFVNRYEREEKTSWMLAVDRSQSMDYGAKKIFAEEFIGILGFLARVWADPCSLFPEGRLPFDEGLKALNEHQLGFQFPRELVYEKTPAREDRLVICSDFFWADEDLKEVLDWADQTFSHTYLVQTLDPKELEFEFNDPMLEFQDLESPDKLVLSVSAVKERYLEELRAHWKKIDSLKSDSVERFVFKSDKNSMGQSLQIFFDRILGVHE